MKAMYAKNSRKNAIVSVSTFDRCDSVTNSRP